MYRSDRVPIDALTATGPVILMSLFDFYIMVDWSGAARRRGMRADAIWIAYGDIKAETPETVSPFSRTEAIQLIHSLLDDLTNKGLRALVCFDFAYGYPRDFAAALQTATGKTDSTLPWLTVWQYLSDAIKDDEGSVPYRKPTNRSNRFDVANKINSLLSVSPEASGPFWCASPEAAYLYLPQGRPRQPFQTAQGFLIQALRLTDQRARSGTPFRPFGTASVGSQSLTGIPRLQNLRLHSKFAPRSAVWPFETGWATKAKWLPKNVSIVHAEIYPSVREHKADSIKDRGQVRSMWQWARDLDRQDLLWLEFSRPAEINPGSKEDIAIQLTEGWILGASPTVRHQ
jgi:precorrin-8X/cobalt-precorrin-8 methylmutase